MLGQGVSVRLSHQGKIRASNGRTHLHLTMSETYFFVCRLLGKDPEDEKKEDSQKMEKSVHTNDSGTQPWPEAEPEGRCSKKLNVTMVSKTPETAREDSTAKVLGGNCNEDKEANGNKMANDTMNEARKSETKAHAMQHEERRSPMRTMAVSVYFCCVFKLI